MKILILHNNNNIQKLRRSTLNFSFALLKYAPEHDYYLHCYYNNPITKELLNEQFDAIILDVTFLEIRFSLPANIQTKFLEKYRFIKDSNAVKIALPQDEFTQSKHLEDWLDFWDVDAVFSPCYNQKEVLYPLLTKKNVEIIKSFTGYVDDDDIKIVCDYILPFNERKIDIGYRGAALDESYGSFGQMKAKLSDNFKNAISKIEVNDLNMDVSNSKTYKLIGENWLKFLCNSRFTLGCESGSSILDPFGEIKKNVKCYVSKNPEASFEQIAENCFPGEDCKYIFNAISPRIFETAIAKSCQILIEGEYSGVIEPWKHYIPLKKDFSNITEVLELMKNTDKVQQIIDVCHKEIIESGKYNYKNFTSKIIEVIAKHKKLDNYNPCNKDDLYNINNIEELLKIASFIGKKQGYSNLKRIKNMNFIYKKLIVGLEYIKSLTN